MVHSGSCVIAILVMIRKPYDLLNLLTYCVCWGGGVNVSSHNQTPSPAALLNGGTLLAIVCYLALHLQLYVMQHNGDVSSPVKKRAWKYTLAECNRVLSEYT